MKRFVVVACGLLLTSAAFAQPLPKPDHIVIVIEENKNFGDVIGKTTYIDNLVQSGASLEAYYGLHHPSQPNYIELFSGAEHGVCNDSCVTSQITAVNLAASLFAAGKTFAGFAEDLPTPVTTCTTGHYARKHCPWINFTGVPMDSARSPAFTPRLPIALLTVAVVWLTPTEVAPASATRAARSSSFAAPDG